MSKRSPAAELNKYWDEMSNVEFSQRLTANGNEVYALSSWDLEEAFRNAIAAVPPNSREVFSWVSRHNGEILQVQEMADWLGVSTDQAMESIYALLRQRAVTRTRAKYGSGGMVIHTLVSDGTRLKDPETDRVTGMILHINPEVESSPKLVSAWRISPYDERPSRELWDQVFKQWGVGE
jgi:hypothetical protein